MIRLEPCPIQNKYLGPQRVFYWSTGKVVWLQPSIAADTARRLSLEYGFDLVDGVDIAGAAR